MVNVPVSLPDLEREILNSLCEEAAVVIVTASKVLRFGSGDPQVARTLGLDIGRLHMMMSLVAGVGLISHEVVLEGIATKKMQYTNLQRYPQ